MTTLQIELPDTVANAARKAGFLTPQALERLFNDALQRKQAAAQRLAMDNATLAAEMEPIRAPMTHDSGGTNTAALLQFLRENRLPAQARLSAEEIDRQIDTERNAWE